MTDRENVIKGLAEISEYARAKADIAGIGKGKEVFDSGYRAAEDARELLREQEPRVMTLEEVIKHYSLPPVFVDDLGAQEDYLQDIAPLYFDFPEAGSYVVHWRNYNIGREYLDHWKSYGVKWRCWTGKPTDEQREAAKWDG